MSGRRRRRGISLVEVMVAVMLLGMLATVHTLVTMRYALQTRTTGTGVARSAALSLAVDLYTTRSFETLNAQPGCTRITSITTLPHDRCIVYTLVSQDLAKIEITIRPVDTAIASITTVLYRSPTVPASLLS